MPDIPPGTTALVPFLGYGDEGTDAWVRMHTSDRRRLAMEAARGKDVTVLLSLTEAWLRTYSKAGATIATGTVENHKHGIKKLLAAWTEEDLLKPDIEAATRYIRLIERQGLKAGTIYGRVAAARALFSALRWARASLYDPFADVHVPHDPTPPWEKRMPNDNDEIAALLDSAADPFDCALVLLGAHGGLRAGKCVRLRWRDVNMTRRDLTIRVSKGGKTRTVDMSASLKQALQGLPRHPLRPRLLRDLPHRRPLLLLAVLHAAGLAPRSDPALDIPRQHEGGRYIAPPFVLAEPRPRRTLGRLARHTANEHPLDGHRGRMDHRRALGGDEDARHRRDHDHTASRVGTRARRVERDAGEHAHHLLLRPLAIADPRHIDVTLEQRGGGGQARGGNRDLVISCRRLRHDSGPQGVARHLGRVQSECVGCRSGYRRDKTGQGKGDAAGEGERTGSESHGTHLQYAI